RCEVREDLPGAVGPEGKHGRCTDEASEAEDGQRAAELGATQVKGVADEHGQQGQRRQPRVVSGSRMLGMGPESPGESGRARNAPRSVDVDPEARAARWLVVEVGAANGNADAGLGGEGD